MTFVLNFFYIFFKSFIQHFIQNFCSKFLCTTFAHNFCFKTMFTIFVYNSSPNLLITRLVHNSCSKFVFTNFTYICFTYFSSHLLFTAFVYKICSEGLLKILVQNSCQKFFVLKSTKNADHLWKWFKKVTAKTIHGQKLGPYPLYFAPTKYIQSKLKQNPPDQLHKKLKSPIPSCTAQLRQSFFSSIVSIYDNLWWCVYLITYHTEHLNAISSDFLQCNYQEGDILPT